MPRRRINSVARFRQVARFLPRLALGLPSAWDPNDYGGAFASAGVSVGNLHLALEPSASLAFESCWAQDGDMTLSRLQDKLNGFPAFESSHEPSVAPCGSTYCPFDFGLTPFKALGGFSSMVPFGNESCTFFVNYNSNGASSRDINWLRLVERGGGPLGIQLAKTVVIGVTDFNRSVTFWQTLLSPYSTPLFTHSQLGLNNDDGVDRACFGPVPVGGGPNFCLVRSTAITVKAIVLSVRSIADARTYATRHGWVNGADPHDANSLKLSKQVTGGTVQIRLVRCSTLVPAAPVPRKSAWCDDLAP